MCLLHLGMILAVWLPHLVFLRPAAGSAALPAARILRESRAPCSTPLAKARELQDVCSDVSSPDRKPGSLYESSRRGYDPFDSFKLDFGKHRGKLLSEVSIPKPAASRCLQNCPRTHVLNA